MTPVTTYPEVSLADIGAELRREIEARRRLYPKRVAAGRMTDDEAAHGIAIAEAMLADLGRMAPAWRPRQESHAFSWYARRTALQRELAMRARLYPGWIHEQKLDATEARLRVIRLEALLWIYEEGFDWRAANGAVPHDLPDHADRDEHAAARVEWRRLYGEIQLARAAHQPSRAGDAAAIVEALIRMLRLDQAPDAAAELEAKLHALRNPEQQKELAL